MVYSFNLCILEQSVTMCGNLNTRTTCDQHLELEPSQSKELETPCTTQVKTKYLYIV